MLISACRHLLHGLTAYDLAAYNGHEDIVDLIHAVELSQSSSASPVLTASEIAAIVYNERLNVLNGAMEKMLVEKVGNVISSHSQKQRKSFPQKMNHMQKFFNLLMLSSLFVVLVKVYNKSSHLFHNHNHNHTCAVALGNYALVGKAPVA